MKKGLPCRRRAAPLQIGKTARLPAGSPARPRWMGLGLAFSSPSDNGYRL